MFCKPVKRKLWCRRTTRRVRLMVRTRKKNNSFRTPFADRSFQAPEGRATDPAERSHSGQAAVANRLAIRSPARA